MAIEEEPNPLDGDDPPPRHLTLADKIDAPVWTSVDCTQVAALRNSLLGLGLPHAQFDLAHVKCTPSTRSALADMPWWTVEAPCAFEFYTDGAFRRQKGSAAAGVVLIVTTTDGQRFGGFHTSHCYSTSSAPRAETSAMITAIFWACHLASTFGFQRAHFVFFFDNLYAGAAAQGRCASLLNSDIAVVLRSLSVWLEQLAAHPIRWNHVKGHSDHPWNDLADAVAYGVLEHGLTTFDLSSLIDCCTFAGTDDTTLQWLWLFEKSIRGHADAPVLQGLQWKLNVNAPFAHDPTVDIQPFMLRSGRLLDGGVDSDFIHLRVATANVLMLFPQHDHASSFLGARAEHLAAQFRTAGIHCIGLQETRCGLSGHSLFGSFHVLSASATPRGHGGLQLWIAKDITIGDSALHISHDHLRIVHADDRRLLVRLHHPQIALFFLVLHAPCSDDEREISQWWATTNAAIPNSCKSWTWVTLCDANGRVGSVPSRAISSVGADDENMRGAAFHDWLVLHNLFLPQTFDSLHHGTYVTWTHAEGTQARLDYIGLSDNVDHSCVQTWISDEIDLSIARPDHSCVCADVWLALSRRRKCETDAVVAEDTVGLPTWQCDVHTHAAKLQQHFKRQLQPPVQKVCRKQHLSSDTLVLIARKKRAFRAVRHAQADARLQRLRICFAAWHSTQSEDFCQDSTFKADLRLAIVREDYRIASLHVCAAVRADDRHFFEDLASHTGQIAERGFHRI